MNKLFGAVGLLVILASCSYKAIENEGFESVLIEEKNAHYFIDPEQDWKSTGIVFYPGGLVEADAYISMLKNLAESGYPVVLLKATADLAIFNVNRASKAIENYPSVDQWVVGGHSLGGVVAAKAVMKNPDLFSGLVFMASYPAGGDDLSAWEGAVLSLYGENDEVTTVEDIKNNKHLLPEEKDVDGEIIEDSFAYTIYHQIDGGNHSQFGDYGFQKGDGEATITVNEQHEEIVSVILNFLSVNFNSLSK